METTKNRESVKTTAETMDINVKQITYSLMRDVVTIKTLKEQRDKWQKDGKNESWINNAINDIVNGENVYEEYIKYSKYIDN